MMYHHDGKFMEHNMIGGGAETMTASVQFSSAPKRPVFDATRVARHLLALSGLTHAQWYPSVHCRFTYWTRESLV